MSYRDYDQTENVSLPSHLPSALRVVPLAVDDVAAVRCDEEMLLLLITRKKQK